MLSVDNSDDNELCVFYLLIINVNIFSNMLVLSLGWRSCYWHLYHSTPPQPPNKKWIIVDKKWIIVDCWLIYDYILYWWIL